jgi:DNA-directed RNA polymerase subunit RPC12/RpoP
MLRDMRLRGPGSPAPFFTPRFLKGKIMPRPSMDEVIAAAEEDDYTGFCIECGEMAEGVEPDAIKYECEYCGKRAVYGAEEIIVQGLFV